MTEPLRIIENPEVSFDDSPIPERVQSAAIYESGLVVLTVYNGSRGSREKHYYPPQRAPVVKE